MKNININNIKVRIILYIFVGFIIVLGVMIATLGHLLYEETIETSTRDKLDVGIETIYKDSPQIIKKFYTYKSQEISIPSKNDYEINGIYIQAKKPSQKTVVFVHGLDSNKWGCIEWAFMYLDEGYNVILYNQSGIGGTGGKGNTFGYYEKEDLASVVDYIDTKYPSRLVGVHGIDLGGSTAALYAGTKEANEKVDFFVLDSPYNGIEKLVEKNIQETKVPRLFTKLIMWIEDVYLKIAKGFGYEDILPQNAVKSSTVPMLIIHGDLDSKSPIDMGVAIYNNKQKGYKDLWIIEGGEHISGYKEYKEEYVKRIMQFIEVSIYNQKK